MERKKYTEYKVSIADDDVHSIISDHYGEDKEDESCNASQLSDSETKTIEIIDKYWGYSIAGDKYIFDKSIVVIAL